MIGVMGWERDTIIVEMGRGPEMKRRDKDDY